MSTTYDDRPTRPRPGTTAAGERKPQLSPEQRLFAQYIHEVERARQHEQEALRQLRAGLGQLAARGHQVAHQQPIAHAQPASSYVHAPYERVQRPARRSNRRSRRWIVFLLAAVLAVTGWMVFRGDDEASTSGMPAGHDMSKMGSSNTSGKVAPGQQIDVDLGEFYVKPAYKKVPSGTVGFTVSNSGKAEHEFMIASLDDLPQDEVENMSSREVHNKVIASKHGVTAGSSGFSVEADLEPGKYLLFCNLPGHYSQGQSTVIEVV